MSLIELIIALTLLSVGVLGLAAAAAVAQRSFASAEAIERATAAAAAVLDSLMHEPDPASGARIVHDVGVSWTVRPDSIASDVTLTVRVRDGARTRAITWHAVYSGRLAR